MHIVLSMSLRWQQLPVQQGFKDGVKRWTSEWERNSRASETAEQCEVIRFVRRPAYTSQHHTLAAGKLRDTAVNEEGFSQ